MDLESNVARAFVATARAEIRAPQVGIVTAVQRTGWVTGQAALHVVVLPSGQRTTSPPSQRVMSQSWVPGDAFGQWTTQLEPAPHDVWQGPLWHVKSQVELGPQSQLPLAQVPLHCGLSPEHFT